MKKEFLIKDKSGRGYVCTKPLTKLLKTFDNEDSWNGEPLHAWAREAEPGDKWETASLEIICTR